MSGLELVHDPAFRSMITATGHGEVWTHSQESAKLGQFGWRCTNKESSYQDKTLVGNWSEARFDIDRLKEAKPLPSQHAHYFDPIYKSSYSPQPYKVPETLKNLKARHPHSFPGHQPELDSDSLKQIYNSWQTSSRAAYIDPRLQASGIPPQPSQPSESKEA